MIEEISKWEEEKNLCRKIPNNLYRPSALREGGTLFPPP